MTGMWFEEFEIGRVYRHPITRTVTEMDNMMFSCLTMNPAAPAHRSAFFGRNRMGPAADELAVHARPDDRHLGQRPDARHHHRQSRHDRRQISRRRCSRATRSMSRPKLSASARAARAPMPASSSSTTAPTSRTARWSRNAAARPSCASGRSDVALAAFRSGRQRKEDREGAIVRRRRHHPRSRGFRRTRQQAEGAVNCRRRPQA